MAGPVQEKSMTPQYVLYGSHASYYTAKTRAYLRKKGIPFIERLPSAPRFREHVRLSSGTHRIPQVEMSDGRVLQDSTEIFDVLESLHPELPALPSTPRQRLVAHLFELFASEGLVILAWQYRWMFEENDRFVRMDFGRSFRPQGSDEELLHYGGIIADRMLSRGGARNLADEVRSAIADQYTVLLQLLEAHFTEHPYMLGGHPSVCDYSMMGALFAHLGRDPLPRTIMQEKAARVFRYSEHMLVPEIQSPEFPDTQVAYPANDEIPETCVALLAHFFAQFGDRFADNTRAFNAWVEKNDPRDGELLSESEDQPVLEGGCQAHTVWLAQRALMFFDGLSGEDRASCETLMERCGGSEYGKTQPTRRIERRDNRLVIESR